MKKRNKAKTTLRPAKASLAPTEKQPLIAHVHELRRRLFYIVVFVAAGGAVAYGLERKIIDALLRPSHGQSFIYTSPMGGINFLFSVCLDIGLVIATPVIIYQLLAFLQPIMKDATHRFLIGSAATAGVVAIGGVLFGYFIGLPSALHFLLHQFTTVQIRPLLTIQAYISFVALYLFGSALMFQLPLIMFIINRIKPLKPSGLFKYERHLIAGAFIVAFIMNPTPNVVDQMIVVVPIIIMYQFGILLIWFVNRGQKPSYVQSLLEQDAQRRAERINRQLAPLDLDNPDILSASEPEDVTYTPDVPAVPVSVPHPEPEPTPASVRVAPRTPRVYPSGMQPRPARYIPLRGQLVQ